MYSHFVGGGFHDLNRLVDDYAKRFSEHSSAPEPQQEAYDRLVKEFIAKAENFEDLPACVCQYYRKVLATRNFEHFRYWTWLALSRPSENYLEYFAAILCLENCGYTDVNAVHWQILDTLAWVPQDNTELWRRSEELLRQAIEIDHPQWVGSDTLHKAFEAFIWNAGIYYLDLEISDEERQEFYENGIESYDDNPAFMDIMESFCRSNKPRIRKEADWWIKNYIYDPDDERYDEQIKRWYFGRIQDIGK